MRGGYRPNSGRKPGSLNNKIEDIRNLISEKDKKELIEKAIKMAKAGNVPVMNKLLDKLLPNLNSVEMSQNTFPEIVVNVKPNRE